MFRIMERIGARPKGGARGHYSLSTTAYTLCANPDSHSIQMVLEIDDNTF